MHVFVVSTRSKPIGGAPIETNVCMVFEDLAVAKAWCDDNPDAPLSWEGGTGCGLQSWTADVEDAMFCWVIERRWLVGA